MQTYFAPTERTSPEELHLTIDAVSNSPVFTKILQSVGGLLAVLDKHRQIVALNDSFLQMLGLKDSTSTFGLRLGEVVKCIHARKEISGCGTSKYCSTCGAAIAIVSALEQGIPIDQTCSISTNSNGKTADLFFSVKAYPIELNNKQFILLFLQDITSDQQRTALERTFFHDVSNMLQILVGASELLMSQENSSLSKTVHQAALRLQDEIAIQRCLSQNNSSTYRPIWKTISTLEIVEDLQQFFKTHPLVRNKKLDFSRCTAEVIHFTTDHSLLWRILYNMLLNALEATDEGQEVKIWFETTDNLLTFKVWNMGTIAEKAANRIFERNFSTKGNSGRGLGTYSMKYFGEKILKGEVSFTSTDEAGTTFCYRTPIS
jgi:K+-sensing histidine kinase KdpD